MSRPSRYFMLKTDVQAGNWYLGDPLNEAGEEVDDIWEFSEGHPVHPGGRLTLPISEPGRRLDYTTAGAGWTPIVHVKVATLLAEMAPDDVQLIPVDVEDCPEQYVMLVVTKLIRCIDDQATEEVLYWKPEDERPDKLGKYRSVYGLRIDPTQVGGVKVFRPWGWTGVLIVSEDIKDALERAHVTGAEFEEV